MDTATQMSEKTIREQLQELDLRKKDLELREHLFNMKWGVLENEVSKLAVERQEFKVWRESEETRLRAMEEELAGISGGDGQTERDHRCRQDRDLHERLFPLAESVPGRCAADLPGRDAAPHGEAPTVRPG